MALQQIALKVALQDWVKNQINSACYFVQSMQMRVGVIEGGIYANEPLKRKIQAKLRIY